eukprot:1406704-Amphidinium_carterae.1
MLAPSQPRSVVRRFSLKDACSQWFLRGWTCAKFLRNDGSQLFKESGVVPYMSPEMLDGTGYDFKTDVWSLGQTSSVCRGVSALLWLLPVQTQGKQHGEHETGNSKGRSTACIRTMDGDSDDKRIQPSRYDVRHGHVGQDEPLLATRAHDIKEDLAWRAIVLIVMLLRSSQRLLTLLIGWLMEWLVILRNVEERPTAEEALRFPFMQLAEQCQARELATKQRLLP